VDLLRILFNRHQKVKLLSHIGCYSRIETWIVSNTLLFTLTIKTAWTM